MAIEINKNSFGSHCTDCNIYSTNFTATHSLESHNLVNGLKIFFNVQENNIFLHPDD